MRETYDFRLLERDASKFLDPGEGKRLGELTRQIIVPRDSRLFELIGEQDQAARMGGRGGIFGGWGVIRKYSPKELRHAELFQLIITGHFEPEGVACGTVYDDSIACRHCGMGRRLVGSLVVDLDRAPKDKDFAQSIARDEWIVSERVVALARAHGMTGAEFACVKSARDHRVSGAGWHRLVVAAPPVDVAPTTRFGIDPFDDDLDGRYRCPNGHVAGLNILSELRICRDSYNGADIGITRQAIGDRRGEVFPHQLLVISPRFRQLLVDHGIKGFKTEVAYLVGGGVGKV